MTYSNNINDDRYIDGYCNMSNQKKKLLKPNAIPLILLSGAIYP